MFAAGAWHSVAISNKSLFQWGLTYLGDGSPLDSHITPTQVKGLLPDISVKSMCGGEWYTMLVTQPSQQHNEEVSSAVYVWGDNEHGHFGLGDANPRPKIVKLDLESMFSGHEIDKVSCGTYFSSFLAVNSGNFLWLAGQGKYGQLGINSTTDSYVPVQPHLTLASDEHVTDVALGYVHSVVLTSLGTVFAWGDNTYGQIGDGSGNQQNIPTKITINSAGGKSITKIACGLYHTLAVEAAETPAGVGGTQVYAWGWNQYGNLCDGTTKDQLKPVKVDMTGAMQGVSVVSMAGGFSVSLFVSGETGQLFGCGEKEYLGIGDTRSYQNVPVLVNRGSLAGKFVDEVSVSCQHALVLNH
eukprot:c9468_g1_i1.p1 GENE.c9468_g1_i1~~c9468_g1_i1.p1  ORF type:complete len:356 (+),score=85.87 c9468_g1_i1:377-1444(+)